MHGLNPPQRAAVLHTDGPLLVLAGAGSGKTRVIVEKIAHLIASGRMPAKRIAAITFTNKAAAEMRERAKSLVGKAAQEVVICTFHALGVRMMRQDGSVLGLKPTPCIKVATNTPMFERLRDDMDLDAGPILEGEPVESVGRRLFDLILDVASGAPTRSERLGVGEEEFAPWQIGPTL